MMTPSLQFPSFIAAGFSHASHGTFNAPPTRLFNMGFSFVYCVVCGCPFDIPPRDEVFDEEHNWASEDPLEDETKQVSKHIAFARQISCICRPAFLGVLQGSAATDATTTRPQFLGSTRSPSFNTLFSYLHQSSTRPFLLFDYSSFRYQ